MVKTSGIQTPETHFGDGIIRGTQVMYFEKDHLGSVRAVLNTSGTVLEKNDYYPFGMRHANASHVVTANNRYKFNGKEDQTVGALGLLDYGARMYDAQIGRWLTVDPLADSYYPISPYAYCHDNPINKIDPNGKWDVNVHLYNKRAIYGYGIAIVTDRHGNEVYRFTVRAEGVKGRDRMKTYADTPLGVYDIPEKNTWITGGNRQSYGPNPRLNMVGISGEIIDSKRSLIRTHGGKQEEIDPKTGKWIASSNPELKETEGCLRAYDKDMIAFKSITDELQKKDSKEFPGVVTILDDLERNTTPHPTKYIETISTYKVPEPEKKKDPWEEHWREFYDNLNNFFNW